VGVLLNTAATGAATPSFAAQATFATGSSPYSVAAADVNGDGKPDLLVANYYSNSVSVLLNTAATGAATPSFAAQATFATGSSPSSVAVADVNGDGKPDLLVANNTSSTVGVLLNATATGAATPSFAAQAAFATGSNPLSVAAADVNGDGKPDLLTANYTSNTVSVLLNTTAVAPTVTTSVPANVTTTGAMLGGNVTADGGAAVTDRGVVYSTTNTTPTIFDTKDANGTGTGSFSKSITGLTPSATYYVRAYATNSAGTSYGALQQFRTVSAPTVTTATPTAITTTSATLGGTIVSTGEDPVTSRGVVYSATNPTPSTGGTNVLIVTGTTGTGSFSQNVTGLTPGTLYYVQAYGTNSLGTRYGAVETFTTTPNATAAPVVTAPADGSLVNTTTPTYAGTAVPGSTVTVYVDNTSIGTTTATTGGDFSLLQPTALAQGSHTVRATAQSTGSTVSANSNTNQFTVGTAPTLTGISPTSGPVGTSVTLTGTNLTGATGVSFNGTVTSTFTSNNGTQLVLNVPTGATSGNVTVTTAGGTSNGVAFTVVTDLVVSTGTQLSPTPIPAGSYNSIRVTSSGNAVLAGNVSVTSFFTVEPGGGLSDGCAVISGAGTFTLGAGSILGICSPQGIAASGASGPVQVTGARSFSTAANYGYTGAAALTGSGLPSTVASLAINTAGNVTLSNPVAVAAAVGVGGAGNLVLNGNMLTLLSSASGTALARNSSTGVVVGPATVQRYIDPSQNPGPGYRHYSAPVSGSTVADLTTSNFTPEVSQGTVYNNSATPGTVTPFPNVFGYDQARVQLSNTYAPFDRGFVAATSTADPLAVGQGYAVNINATALVDFVGTLNNGPRSLTLARNAAGTPNESEAGWHLVGNPYPAPLDYSLVAPADRAGLDAAMYVYESAGQYTGSYRSYVNGLPAANRFVGTAQGFFVRVSPGLTSGTLTFQNSQRVTDPTAQVPFRRSTADLRPLVQLNLRGATGPVDALYAYAEAGATPAFDAAFDAVKLPNTTGLNLASIATSSEALAIDGRPAFTATTVLPLTVGVPAAGTYTLTAAALSNLPAGLDALLTDATTGQTVNLSRQSSYSFAVTAAQAQAVMAGRFVLHFAASSPLATAPALTAAEVTLYPNPAHDQFTVLVPAVAGASLVQGTLLNALGQAVRQQATATTAAGARLGFNTSGLAAGVYTLRLQAGSTTLAKRVVLQ
ncbi:FG-GAP-like repeat-containing protein, partial [Hymenobacter sp. BT770]|uniref:FG-GAP-like repeat-containing protein n=1 Tax=Hymenobacter sp. BT770 TaxID=2886942 RepID=UPI001D120158